MSLGKVAVFTTSEIFQYGSDHTERRGGPTKAVRYRIPKEDWSRLGLTESSGCICTTGSLEAAIEQGYTIHVVSSRSKLGAHDDWWMALLRAQDGGPRLLLPDKVDPDDMTDHGHTERLNAPWQALYAQLGLAYPQINYGAGLQPEFWTAARHELEVHGVRLGSSFSHSQRGVPPRGE